MYLLQSATVINLNHYFEKLKQGTLIIMSFEEQVIRERLNILADFEFCHPIDIFSISSQIKDELYPSDSISKIVNDFGSHESTFVRRAILTSFRFIGDDLPQQHIELVRRGLKDDDDWVVYDSAWILLEMDSISSEDIQSLRAIAGDLNQLSADELEILNPNRANEYAAKQAAEALLKHTQA